VFTDNVSARATCSEVTGSVEPGTALPHREHINESTIGAKNYSGNHFDGVAPRSISRYISGTNGCVPQWQL